MIDSTYSDYSEEITCINDIMPRKQEINLEDILKELGPEELVTVANVLHNLQNYIKMYESLTKYILSEYPDIDIDKIPEIADEIDHNISYLGFGERLYIYNKLNEPLIVDLFKKMGKEDLLKRHSWIKDINISILALHPNIDIRKLEKYMKEIDNKIKNLKYEEKFLIFNMLGYIILLDLAETLQ